MFDLAAARRGDHWKLSTDERRAVGDSLANVLRHVNLPERELGIAADIAAVGLVFYSIVTPRLEYERRMIASVGGADRSPAPPTPPRSAAVADTHPNVVGDLDALMRAQFPDGFDMANPEHVNRFNAIAAGIDVSAPLEVSGDALDTSRPITGDVHSTPGFFPNGEA